MPSQAFGVEMDILGRSVTSSHEGLEGKSSLKAGAEPGGKGVNGMPWEDRLFFESEEFS